jgi:hypothetical protein
VVEDAPEEAEHVAVPEPEPVAEAPAPEPERGWLTTFIFGPK